MNLQTFLYLLALLFIALQLTHFIAWQWWAVTAPLLVLPALQFTAGLFIGFFKALAIRRAKRST